MASTRIVIGFVVTGASALVALAACSGTTSSTGTGDGGASSSGTSGSGTSGGTSGSGTSGGSSIKQCPSSGSKCTDAENQAYGSCIQEKCDATFTKCYGADYKNGNFSGACGTYITCTQACACGDTACLTKCTFDDACKNCVLPAVSTCSEQCTPPACATGGSSGSSGTSGSSGGAGKTCADLKACCDKIPAGSTKDSCNQTYDSLAGMDSQCAIVYSGYAPSCP
ncbi:MAG TPA: hypothetical protein VLT33_13700 [Labilithrix sp.]|nr:hypothetical protein [Labilithrix sp.]